MFVHVLRFDSIAICWYLSQGGSLPYTHCTLGQATAASTLWHWSRYGKQVYTSVLCTMMYCILLYCRAFAILVCGTLHSMREWMSQHSLEGILPLTSRCDCYMRKLQCGCEGSRHKQVQICAVRYYCRQRGSTTLLCEIWIVFGSCQESESHFPSMSHSKENSSLTKTEHIGLESPKGFCLTIGKCGDERLDGLAILTASGVELKCKKFALRVAIQKRPREYSNQKGLSSGE